MKLNFNRKNKMKIKVGDVIVSHVSGASYMVIRCETSSNYRYSLLDLRYVTVLTRPFESIDDLISCQFDHGQYDVIPNEDLVLSSSN